MGRFIVRRLFSMVLVLFAISVLTFLIFKVIPNGDPAARMAGKNSTPEQIEAIRAHWGFDKPLWQQYVNTMEKIFIGRRRVLHAPRVNVVDEIKGGAAAHVRRWRSAPGSSGSSPASRSACSAR